jgi:uroporphyrinogen-III synthase
MRIRRGETCSEVGVTQSKRQGILVLTPRPALNCRNIIQQIIFWFILHLANLTFAIDAPVTSQALFFTTNPSVHSLVDLGLGQAGDLLSTVLDLAVGKLETAQDTRALFNSVVAGQLVVRNTVQSPVAFGKKNVSIA